jgi:hypothetical protein
MIEAKEFCKTVGRGRRHYAHASVPLDVNADVSPSPITVFLHRSVPIRGRLVDPSGKPVKQALMLSRLCVSNDIAGFSGWPATVADGQFELCGLDRQESAQVLFLDPKNRIGATVEISGEPRGDEPLVIQLRPCGQATARFVAPDGKPLVKFTPPLQIVVTPGPSFWTNNRERFDGEFISDMTFVGNVDQINHRPLPRTDRQGRCTFPALIPGATYRLPQLLASGKQDEFDFTVESGQYLQLPDITLTPEY